MFELIALGKISFLAIFGVLTAVIFGLFLLGPDRDWPVLICKGVVSLVISLLITVVTFTIISQSYTDRYTEVKDREIQLVSLNDELGITGRFYLGTGGINNTMTYAYYIQTNRGKKAYTISADQNCDIYVNDTLSEGETPRLEIFKRNYDNVLIHNMYKSYRIYVFYVPKNSVMPNYILDAK